MSKVKFQRSQKSSREIRRIAEREQKRQQSKEAIGAFLRLSPDERQRRIKDNMVINNIQRNGITIDDLENAGQEGFMDGAKMAAENTMKNIYAAVALVLHEKLGYEKNQCMDILNLIDQKVVYALESKEMIQKVWDDIGLELSFDGDTFDDRITEKEE